MRGVPGLSNLHGVEIGVDTSGLVLTSRKNLSFTLVWLPNEYECSQDDGIGRIAGSQIYENADNVFTGSQTGTVNYDWNPWEGVIVYKLRTSANPTKYK